MANVSNRLGLFRIWSSNYVIFACPAHRLNTGTASCVPEQDLTSPLESQNQLQVHLTGWEARDLASAGNTISPYPSHRNGDCTSPPAMAPEWLHSVIKQGLISSPLPQEEDTKINPYLLCSSFVEQWPLIETASLLGFIVFTDSKISHVSWMNLLIPSRYQVHLNHAITKSLFCSFHTCIGLATIYTLPPSSLI